MYDHPRAVRLVSPQPIHTPKPCQKTEPNNTNIIHKRFNGKAVRFNWKAVRITGKLCDVMKQLCELMKKLYQIRILSDLIKLLTQVHAIHPHLIPMFVLLFYFMLVPPWLPHGSLAPPIPTAFS